MPALPSRSPKSTRRPHVRRSASANVVVDLTNDPNWCHTVESGVIEHANRFMAQDRSAVGMKVTTKLLVEPAMEFCARFTGDEIVLATDGAFDVDQYKEGSVTVSRDFLNQKILPLSRRFQETCSTGEKQRWGTRQVVMACLFLYANHLVKNHQRADRFIR